MKHLVVFLIFLGFIGYAFAEEIPVEIQTPNDVDLVITGVTEISDTKDPIVRIIIEDEYGYPILLTSISPDGTGHFSLDVKRQGPLWDGITEFLVKAIVAKPVPDVVVQELEPGMWNVGKITWKEASYRGFENDMGRIQVIDPDVNQYGNALDFLRVKLWSDSSSSGTEIILTETGTNTGIFEGDVIFSNTHHFSRGVLFVSTGDTATAMYVDTTLPNDMGVDVYKANATALVVGKRGPPMERAPASDLRITDIHKSAVGIPVSVDQQIMLVSDLQSNMDETLPFVYLVQIKNEQDKVESLSWIAGNLTSSQTLTPGVTWIPFYEGWYTATAFVWEAIDNPTAHSPPVTLEFQVQK